MGSGPFSESLIKVLFGLGRERGYCRFSLETGSMAAFMPARPLYAAAGFEPCEPFGKYSAHTSCRPS